MNKDKLLAKLKKLLAMSQGNANENEAMVAAKQLHVLLTKHNISMSELNDSTDTVSENRILMSDRPWKRKVAGSIARLYFCDFFYTSGLGSGKSYYSFVGTDANRIFAQNIFEMVIKTVDRESRRASKERYGKENCSFVNSFWTGASDRIVKRCKELMVSAKHGNLQDDNGTTLPAMLSVYEQSEALIQLWLSEEHPDLIPKPTRTQTATNIAGHKAGTETGDKVQISRVLPEASPKLIEMRSEK